MKVIYLEDYRNTVDNQATAKKRENYKSLIIPNPGHRTDEAKNNINKLMKKIIWLLIIGMLGVSIFLLFYFLH